MIRCWLLLPLWDSVIVLCFVVRYFMSILVLQSSELVALLTLSSWRLVIVVRLFLAVPWVCLQFVIVVFPDHTHLLFQMLKSTFDVIIWRIVQWRGFWIWNGFEAEILHYVQNFFYKLLSKFINPFLHCLHYNYKIIQNFLLSAKLIVFPNPAWHLQRFSL